MYDRLSKGNASHIGRRYVRTALDSFTIPRVEGAHHCLVHTPLWGSLRDMIARSPNRDRFTEELLRATLYRLFQALDYLHRDRKIIHTGMMSICCSFWIFAYLTLLDISATNVLLEISDESVLDSFVSQEIENPSPRKEVEDYVIYSSRLFGWPPGGEPVLCDFGSAENGDADNTRNAGPDVYRAPEVMLKMNWSYNIDIWNIGVLVRYLAIDK